LVLAGRLSSLTAAEANAEQLDAFLRRADGIGVKARGVLGRWPVVGEHVEAADLVVCQHVL
jgi:hypothetical protein